MMSPINAYQSKQPELSSDVYSAIIEALSENAIFSVTDEKGNIVFANQKWKTLKLYFENSMRVFILIVIPLLIIAAIIEGSLIFILG